MQRDKVIWLASWYPNEMDPYNGDFIQRRAKAASAFVDIDVFHVLHETSVKKNEVSSTIVHPALVEHCIKIRKQKGWWGRAYGVLQYFFCCKNALDAHLQQHAMPLVVHVHVPIRSGVLALYLKWRYGLRFIVSEHWGIYNESDRSFRKRNFFFKWITRKIVAQAEKLTTVSDDLGKSMSRMVIRKEHIVIPNVVDTSLFHLSARSQKKDAFIFLHASTMLPVKNVEGIIRAFAAIVEKQPKAELVLLGNNSIRILDAVKKAGIASRTTVIGMSPYGIVAEWMKKVDALVMFSHSENTPGVISEAHCCGIPVIATSVGGIPEMINDTNGMLVGPSDEHALAKAMTIIIAKKSCYDPELISATARERYAYERVGQKFLDLYAGFRVRQ